MIIAVSVSDPVGLARWFVPTNTVDARKALAMPDFFLALCRTKHGFDGAKLQITTKDCTM